MSDNQGQGPELQKGAQPVLCACSALYNLYLRDLGPGYRSRDFGKLMLHNCRLTLESSRFCSEFPSEASANVKLNPRVDMLDMTAFLRIVTLGLR